MKRLFVVLTLGLAGMYVSAQNITGEWNGILKVQTIQLRIVFHVTKTANGYDATMDSPDQGAAGIPVTTTTFKNSILTLNIPNLGVEYNGEFKGDSIAGTFKQSGLSIPLVLTREMPEKETLNRPRESQLSYSYYAEDMVSPNANAGITLACTLIMPEKKTPISR